MIAIYDTVKALWDIAGDFQRELAGIEEYSLPFLVMFIPAYSPMTASIMEISIRKANMSGMGLSNFSMAATTLEISKMAYLKAKEC